MATFSSVPRIGITGNIGSGKTSVCQLFEIMGIPVYYADFHAKRLMTDDSALVAGIRQLLGAAAYLPDGELNRSFVAQAVFGDEAKLRALNALVHPAVGQDGHRWHTSPQNKSYPYTLYEAALLYESGHAAAFDYVIVVTAPEELRLKRVIQRDLTTRQAVLARMTHQWPEEKKIARADFIIQNDSQHSLVQQVWHLHRQLLQLTDRSHVPKQ